MSCLASLSALYQLFQDAEEEYQLLLCALQVKISDQTYSIGAFLGKDPEDVKHQKQEKLSQQIVDVSPTKISWHLTLSGLQLDFSSYAECRYKTCTRILRLG